MESTEQDEAEALYSIRGCCYPQVPNIWATVRNECQIQKRELFNKATHKKQVYKLAVVEGSSSKITPLNHHPSVYLQLESPHWW